MGPSDRSRALARALALTAAGLSLCWCASRPQREGVAPAPAIPERWVDAYAAPGGDGSSERPFKTLTQALGAGVRVRLRAGLYQGPFRLPAGASLQGPREAVLYADGEAEAVAWADDASLEGLSVQGGRTGLFVAGEVRLDQVAFSGQRTASVRVLNAGSLLMRGSTLDGTVSQTRGVVVEPSAVAAVETCTFTGAFARALDVAGGRLTVDRSSVTGAVEAVHLEDGEATLRSVEVGDGRGAGLFVAGGRLVLRGVHVTGHEFGLLTGKGSTLLVEGFVSQRAQRAALSIVHSRGTFKEVELLEPGSYGGLQALDSELTMEHVVVRRATSAGLMVRQGRLSATDIDIDAVADEREADGSRSGGDGVHVRDAVVVLTRVKVTDAQGAGLYATAFAEVTATDLRCERCKLGALLVERGAYLKAFHVESRGASGPAVVVPDQATIELEGLSVGKGEDVVWAECRQGAKVSLSGSLPPLDAVSACVKVR